MPRADATHAHRAVPSAESGASRHPSYAGGPRSYERHRPEDTVLYKTVQAQWKTFLSELESAAEPPVLPAFVIAEVEAFLRCGILAHGFVLAKCRECGWSSDGMGSAGPAMTICVGCHKAAGMDNTAHTPSVGGRDYVYTPVR